MSVRSYHFGQLHDVPDEVKLIELRSTNAEFKALTDLVRLACEGGRHPDEVAYVILDWYNPNSVRNRARA